MADKIILDYEAKYDILKKELAEVKGLLKGTETVGKKAASETSKAFNAAGASINRYGIEAVKSANQADKAIQRVNKSTRDLVVTTNRVGDRTAAGFNKVGDSVRTVGKQTSMFSGMLPGLNAGLGQMAGAMGVAFSVQQVIAFGKASVEAAANFEKAVSELSSITGIVGEDLNFFREAAKELSVADLGGINVTSSAEDIVKAFSLVGSAKPELLASKEALKEVTTQAIILAEASGLALPDAVKALTDVMNQFGAPADQAGKYIDALAAGAKYGAAAIPQVAEAMVKFGAAAKASNVSVAESTALIETLADRGIQGAEAGTAIRNVLLKLSNAPGLSREALRAFKTAGIDMKVLTDNSLPLETRLRETSKLLKTQTGLLDVFGAENVIAAQNILTNIDRYKQLTEQLGEVGVATEQAKINTDNYAARLKQFNNELELLKISLGDTIMPVLIQAFEGMRTSLEFTRTEVDLFREGMQTGFGNLQDIINKIKLNDFRGALEQLNQGALETFNMTAEAGQKLWGLFGVELGKTAETVTVLDKVMLELATMTDQELNVALKELAAQGKYSEEQLAAMADTIRQKKVVEIFNELSKAITLSKDKQEELISITDKYGNTALTNSQLILEGREAYKNTISDLVTEETRLANKKVLQEAYEKFNKTLGVTRVDFDNYLKILADAPDVITETEKEQNKLTTSTKHAIGPYEALTKAVSGSLSKLQDLAALALRGLPLEDLGDKAEKLKKAQFDLALANNLVTISIGDYSKELEDLSKFMDGDGKFLFDIPGGAEQEAKIKSLIDAYNEQIKKLKELKDINDELKKQDEENIKLQQDKLDQEKQFAEERAQTQQDAVDFLKSLGFDVNTEYQKQLNDLNAFYASKLISDEEYSLALQKLYGDQAAALAGGLAGVAEALNTAMGQIFGEAAEKNLLFLAFSKTLTIAQITLSAIQAVASGIAKLASSNPLDIISGVTSIIAGVGNLIGGLTEQVNSIAAPQVPSFFVGTSDTGSGGSLDENGGFLAKIHKHEAIIPEAANMSEPGMADAWINGNIDEFILGKWMPEYVEKNMPQLMSNGYGDIEINDWDDSGLQEKLDTQINVTIQTNNILSKMVQSGKNPWSC